MPLESLNHYTVRTREVERSRKFYADVLGLKVGDRPPFDFPGLWLYTADGVPALHLVGIEDGNEGLTAYLGDGNGEGGTGAFDHIAFQCTGIDETEQRLKAAGINYVRRQVPLLNLHQLFVEDPDGVKVELNFAATERM